MSTTIVKNYNVGEIKLDLPSRQFIHELPLFSFSDIYQSVNVSLIYNSLMKEDGSNPFNITSGFKLNLQKRIIFEDSKIFVQDELGKIEEAYGSNNIYSLGDESKRIIRQKEDNSVVTYEIEYYDYSKEVYNSAGKIITTYDKYGTIIFQYEYYSTGELKKICYRSSKNINLTYINSILTTINYDFNIEHSYLINLSYNTNSINVSHYSGSYFVCNYNTNAYSVYSLESLDSNTQVKSNEIAFDADNNTVIIEKKVNSEIIDSVSYSSKEWTTLDDYASQVDITDYYGVKTRIQYYGKKLLCSYEINENDIELNSGFYPNVVSINNTNNEYGGNCSFRQTINDGLKIGSPLDNGLMCSWNIDSSITSLADGYYILTGWIKSPDVDEYPNNDVNFYFSIDNGSEISIKVPNEYKHQWRFLSYKFTSESSYIKINTNDNKFLLADFRLIFQCTSLKDDKELYTSKAKEEILIHKNSGEIIPLQLNTIYNEDYSAIIEEVYLSDLIRYKLNQRKNINENELYYNECKNVVLTTKSISVIYYDSENIYHEESLDNFDLGYRLYSNSKKYVLKIIIDNNQSNSIRIENIIDDTICGFNLYNDNFDIIEKKKDAVTTKYTYTNGLPTAEEVVGLYTRTKIYSVDNEFNQIITNTDEFNKTEILKYEPIWGKLISITLPDGTIITNEYDTNYLALIEKSISLGTEKRINSLRYSNNYLERVETNSLKYRFNFEKDNLERVNRIVTNESTEDLYITEQHVYNIDEFKNTTITSKWPSNASSLYSSICVYNKYGQFKKEENNILISYDLDPYVLEVEGEDSTFNTLGYNGKDGKIASVTDLTNNDIIKYGYLKNKINSVGKYNSSNELLCAQENYYDDIQRLTSNLYLYDKENLKYSESIIEYKHDVTDPAADDTVKTYTFSRKRIDLSDGHINTISLVTNNLYNIYKMIAMKTYELNGCSFNKNFHYDKTRINRVVDNNDEFNYEYDDLNRIKSISTSVYSINYQYDVYGQLIREDNGRLNKTYKYEYDSIGNIISKKTYSYTISELESPMSTKNYSYTNTIYPDRLTSYNNKSITYNSVGAITSYDGDTYTWSAGKLTLITNGNLTTGMNRYTYTYNGLGQRIKKTHNFLPGKGGISNLLPEQLTSSTSNYTYDFDGRLIKENISKTYYGLEPTTEELFFLYDQNMIVGMIYTKNGVDTVYYLQRNLLGDVVGVYDTEGLKVVEYVYDAWGNCTIKNTTNYTIANINPIRYRGYYYDIETSLFWISSRYYSPELCRFISPDSVEYLNPESINGLNLYCYCFNNPIMYKDNSGHYPEWIGILGSTTENVLNFTETLLNTVLMPTSLSMQQAKVLARNSGHLYSARHFIRGREDDIARTLKLSKNISRAAKVIGGALFVMDVATTWYTNYNSGSDTWVTDCLTDTVIDVVIFLVGYCGPYGWIAALILSGAKYLIEENTTWIEDLKDFTAKNYKPIFLGAIGAK